MAVLKIVPSIAGLCLIGSIALANPLLENDAHITNTLTSAALAKKITDECPNAEPRMVTAFGKALALKSYAKNKGASDEEIDAFINNDAQKNRIIANAKSYLLEQGLNVNSSAEDFCALAKREIANGSLTGSIIRMK